MHFKGAMCPSCMHTHGGVSIDATLAETVVVVVVLGVVLVVAVREERRGVWQTLSQSSGGICYALPAVRSFQLHFLACIGRRICFAE